MNQTFIIAEAGSNHDGSLVRALKLVGIAKDAGANAVKFQLIKPFKPEWIDTLIQACNEIGIEFIATPFNQAGIDALKGKVKRWKIASTEAADESFVKSVFEAATGSSPVYISDGAVEKDITLAGIPMVCVVKYPAQEIDYHFSYKENELWGLSDHTLGNILGVIAVSKGASVVEKHFTDDKKREGPDHLYSQSPEELKTYIALIRLVDAMKVNKKVMNTEHVGRKIEWP